MLKSGVSVPKRISYHALMGAGKESPDASVG